MTEDSSNNDRESEKRRWRRIGLLLLVPTAVFGITAVIAAAMKEGMAARISMALAFCCGIFSLNFLIGQRWKSGDPLPPLIDPFE
jgi:hypothetical protein